MKKEVIQTKSGTFTDPVTGKQRHYVVAAISQVIEQYYSVVDVDSIGDIVTHAGVKSSVLCGDDGLVCDVVKKLSLGIAICNEQDKFNEELGKQIAIGKARVRPVDEMYVTSIGMINKAVVDAIIDQTMYYFEKNPGYAIAAFAEKKRKS